MLDFSGFGKMSWLFKVFNEFSRFGRLSWLFKNLLPLKWMKEMAADAEVKRGHYLAECTGQKDSQLILASRNSGRSEIWLDIQHWFHRSRDKDWHISDWYTLDLMDNQDWWYIPVYSAKVFLWSSEGRSKQVFHLPLRNVSSVHTVMDCKHFCPPLGVLMATLFGGKN